jgi:hypothetical protein
MRSAVALMGAIDIDNVMFALDYPYESTAEAVAFLDSARCQTRTAPASRTSTPSASSACTTQFDESPAKCIQVSRKPAVLDR